MRLALLVLSLLVASPAFALEARSPAMVHEFRQSNPCPSTKEIKGACPGYVVDHLWPLCAGGEDAPSNMGWQEVRASYAKDRVERALCRCLRAHK